MVANTQCMISVGGKSSKFWVLIVFAEVVMFSSTDN
jgi:hypothetical protein